MKNSYTPLFFLFFFFFSFNIFSQIPAGYYDSANGLTGNALKSALNNIISGQTVYPYTSSGTDVWDILKESDRDPNNAANVILLYTGWSVDAAQEYNSGAGWTREHCWPKSHGFPLEEQPAYTDCHHLRPCDVSVNSARNSRWYGECNDQYFDQGGTIPTDSWTSSTDWVWKPRDAVKGDCARMIFYMATRYEGEYNAVAGVTEPDLEIDDFIPADNYSSLPEMAVLSDLLAWSEQDPVDDFERNRNEVVYSYQGNRNPFIDHPEYVCLVFGTNCPGSVVNPDPFTATGITTTQIDLNWGLNANSDNVIVAWNTTNTFGTPSGNYSAGNIITGGGTVLYNGNATNFSHTGLAQQTYYYKIWSYDSTPEYSSGVEVNATPIIPEPTNDPTNFSVTGTTFSSIDLSWTDASSGTLPSGYLIKANTGTITNPVDGVSEADGTFVKNIAQGTQIVSFSGLNASTNYNFKIYPYTNSGTSIDYKTSSPQSAIGITDDIPTACATDLIISEYCEGSSYNKYIEIYNKTGGNINLDNYRLIKGTNGNDFPLTGNIISFVGGAILANDNVYVVSHSSASSTILALADNTDGDANFNGDDAIALQKTLDGGTNWTSIDVIGVEGIDPGTAWAVAGISSGTAEHTLVRKESIINGNTDWASSAGTNIDDSEWEVYAQDDFSFLGFHTMNCNPVITDTWQGDDSTNPNDWQTNENWDKGSIPTSSNNVIIPAVSNFPIIDDGITTAMCNNLTIDAGANVTITSAGQLTVSGILTNNAGNSGILIQSDITSNGSLIQSTSNIEATVEKYVIGNKWHLMYPTLSAIPTSTYTTEGFNTNYNLYSYDETKEDYWNATDIFGTTGWTSEILSSNLRTDKGFVFNRYNLSDKTYLQTGGYLNAQDVTFDINYTVSTIPIVNNVTELRTYFDGWNLVGNPYTSAIDWDQVSVTNIESGIYYLDGDNYKYYLQGGNGTQNPPYDIGISLNGGSRYIPSGQGFMVKTTNEGSSYTTSLTIPQSARIHNTQTFYKNTERIPNLLRMQIEKDNFSDELIVRTLPNDVSDEFDTKYDAYKMFSFNNNLPQIYTLNNDKSINFAINSIPEISDELIIPVGIYSGKQEQYSIKIIENSFDDTEVRLRDKLLNRIILLTQNNVYTCEINKGTDSDRFELIFNKTASTVSNIKPTVSIFPNPVSDKLYIRFSDNTPKNYLLTDITGKVVLSGTFKSETNQLKFESNHKGIFLLQIKLSSGKMIYKKVIVG